MKSQLKALAVGLVAYGALSAPGALAAPFAYDQTAAFDCSQTVVDPNPLKRGGSAANNIVCTSSQLSWYSSLTAPNRSSLTLDTYRSVNPFGGSPFGGDGGLGEIDPNLANASAESITPDDNLVILSRLTHHNAVLPFTNGATSFEYDTVINGTIDLADLAPVGPIGGPFPDSVDYVIHFTETRNRTLLTDCPAPNPVGTRCDDIYTVAITGLNAIPFTGLDGKLYTMVFELIAGNNVAVIPGDGVLSVYTGEGADTRIYVGARIVTVAEPNVVLLLSSMLLAGGVLSRTRKSK